MNGWVLIGLIFAAVLVWNFIQALRGNTEDERAYQEWAAEKDRENDH